VSAPQIVKDTEIFLECGAEPARHRCVVRERRGDHLVVEHPASLALACDQSVSVFFELRGSFWVQEARWIAELASDSPRTGELELCGAPIRVEHRSTLRVPVGSYDLRALLAGQDCAVLDLSEVSFAVRARGTWAPQDVLEAVLYDAGEALPGRVCVQSVTPLDRGWKRFGLSCLDGRLKFALASVCLAVQRAEIARARRGRAAEPARARSGGGANPDDPQSDGRD